MIKTSGPEREAPAHGSARVKARRFPQELVEMAPAKRQRQAACPASEVKQPSTAVDAFFFWLYILAAASRMRLELFSQRSLAARLPELCFSEMQLKKKRLYLSFYFDSRCKRDARRSGAPRAAIGGQGKCFHNQKIEETLPAGEFQRARPPNAAAGGRLTGRGFERSQILSHLSDIRYQSIIAALITPTTFQFCSDLLRM